MTFPEYEVDPSKPSIKVLLLGVNTASNLLTDTMPSFAQGMRAWDSSNLIACVVRMRSKAIKMLAASHAVGLIVWDICLGSRRGEVSTGIDSKRFCLDEVTYWQRGIPQEPHAGQCNRIVGSEIRDEFNYAGRGCSECRSSCFQRASKCLIGQHQCQLAPMTHSPLSDRPLWHWFVFDQGDRGRVASPLHRQWGLSERISDMTSYLAGSVHVMSWIVT